MTAAGNNRSSASGGVSIGGVLLIVFVVLKLVHAISWSWLWVLSPLWIGAGLLAVALVFFAGFALVVHVLSEFGDD